MTILFAVTMLSFCALLWASFSVARHLRRSYSVPKRGHLHANEMVSSRGPR